MFNIFYIILNQMLDYLYYEFDHNINYFMIIYHLLIIKLVIFTILIVI